MRNITDSEVRRFAAVLRKPPLPADKLCVAFEVSNDGIMIFVFDDGSKQRSTITVGGAELDMQYTCETTP